MSDVGPWNSASLSAQSVEDMNAIPIGNPHIDDDDADMVSAAALSQAIGSQAGGSVAGGSAVGGASAVGTHVTAATGLTHMANSQAQAQAIQQQQAIPPPGLGAMIGGGPMPAGAAIEIAEDSDVAGDFQEYQLRSLDLYDGPGSSDKFGSGHQQFGSMSSGVSDAARGIFGNFNSPWSANGGSNPGGNNNGQNQNQNQGLTKAGNPFYSSLLNAATNNNSSSVSNSITKDNVTELVQKLTAVTNSSSSSSSGGKIFSPSAVTVGQTATATASDTVQRYFHPSCNGDPIPSISITASTWARESHGLYDYESRTTLTKSFSSIQQPITITRKNADVNLQVSLPHLPIAGNNSDELLARIVIRNNKFCVDAARVENRVKSGKLWRVVKDVGEYCLQEGDNIKLGRFKMRVKQFVPLPNHPGNNNGNSATPEVQPMIANVGNTHSTPPRHCNTGDQALEDLAEISCRICLLEGSSVEDPLIRPCECKGTIEYVHLNCLRHWVKGKLDLGQDNAGQHGSYFFKPMSCELCKTIYSSHMLDVDKQNLFPLVELPPTTPPFIVLERDCNRSDLRGVHVISLAEKKLLKLGRGHESDVRFADVSISRWHATVHYDHSKGFILTDHRSKFGTLVATKTPLPLEIGSATGSNPNGGPTNTTSLQIGRTVLEFKVNTPNQTLLAEGAQNGSHFGSGINYNPIDPQSGRPVALEKQITKISTLPLNNPPPNGTVLGMTSQGSYYMVSDSGEVVLVHPTNYSHFDQVTGKVTADSSSGNNQGGQGGNQQQQGGGPGNQGQGQGGPGGPGNQNFGGFGAGFNMLGGGQQNQSALQNMFGGALYGGNSINDQMQQQLAINQGHLNLHAQLQMNIGNQDDINMQDLQPQQHQQHPGNAPGSAPGRFSLSNFGRSSAGGTGNQRNSAGWLSAWGFNSSQAQAPGPAASNQGQASSRGGQSSGSGGEDSANMSSARSQALAQQVQNQFGAQNSSSQPNIMQFGQGSQGLGGQGLGQNSLQVASLFGGQNSVQNSQQSQGGNQQQQQGNQQQGNFSRFNVLPYFFNSNPGSAGSRGNSDGMNQ